MWITDNKKLLYIMLIKTKIFRNISRIKSIILYSWRFRSWGYKSIIKKPDLLLNTNQIVIGNNVEIRKGSRLEARGEITKNPKIEIGDNTSIHFYFHCGAMESIKIGKNVLIAGRVFITDHDHIFSDPKTPPLHSGWNISPVVIEDEVWIGEGAAIMKGVTIGKRSVIGANAVVTKNVLPYSVVGGVPAKLIKRIEILHG